MQAVPTEDGFVIPLPYGTKSDWLKNIMAAGSATIVWEGDEYVVTRPEVVAGSEADRYFSRKDVWSHHVYRVDEFVRVTKVELKAPRTMPERG